ncbi:MAG: type II secretion system protein [Alphaproteobacteria bacterium]|nr:type II secretion system protein [Alphaproteobacteria bacterium]
MTILSKNDQRGRSMVEMLGVLAIIGVLSVGGISGYSKAMAKFKLTKAQDQMSMLLMNIRTAFATSPSYEGLNNTTAVYFAIAPGDMYSGAISSNMASVDHLNNAFGGAAHVFECTEEDYVDDNGKEIKCYGLPSTATPDQFFAIAMSNLGREACVSMASSDWGTDGLISIQVIPKNKNETKKAAADLPITMMEAGSICGNYGETASIVWTYY